MKRRELLAGTAGIAAFSAAGCLGVVGLDEHEATPAGVEPAVREETGYEQTNVEEMVIKRTVDIAGTSQDVRVTNYLTEHEKSIDLGPIGSIRAASFVVLTSPQISVVGKNFNPIANMSSDELVDLIEADFDAINNAEHVSDGTVSLLGQETTESLYEAEATFNGATTDVDIHITESVETTNDHLITIGVYPKQVRSVESDNIEQLRSGIVESIE
jgi:hypothetical protein